MIEIPITYTDFSGETVTEMHSFNLSRAELIERELNEKNGEYEDMEHKIRALQSGQKGAPLLDEFKKIVKKAWGQRSPDRRKFYKDDAGYRDFEASGAYDELFLMLTTNEVFAAEWINGLLPANINDLPGQPGTPAPTQPVQPPQAPVADNRLASERRSDEARARSEAAMQGHKAPREREPETVQSAPDSPAIPQTLPDEDQASPPIEKLSTESPTEFQPSPAQPYDDPRIDADRRIHGPGYVGH